MNRLTFGLKNNLNKLPVNVGFGRIISNLPYKFRPGIGRNYQNSFNELKKYESLGNSGKKEFIYKKFKNLIIHAYDNTNFYRQFYNDLGFNPSVLQSFDDIKNVPIVNKTILKQHDIEFFSFDEPGRALANTGGSSGSPFYFYTSPKAIGHEWAHIHSIWARLGFKPSSLKMNFHGRSDIKNFLQYDFLRNSLALDIYCDYSKAAETIYKYINNYKVEFLHGYPSAIFEFALFCETDLELTKAVKKSLKGIFFTSEFPHRYYRNKIEQVFSVPTQSFYGHTERCIMAYEDEPYNFKVLQSYGFAEIDDDCLVGTSYNSFATPLIRYNTEDKVKDFAYEDGILNSFKLLEGRNGEFILDVQGKKIPLTGLIFGRHHKLFNFVSSIQVYQPILGAATILYVTDKELTAFQAEQLFDSRNVDMKFSFKRIYHPLKTISGKVQLRVNTEDF